MSATISLTEQLAVLRDDYTYRVNLLPTATSTTHSA